MVELQSAATMVLIASLAFASTSLQNWIDAALSFDLSIPKPLAEYHCLANHPDLHAPRAATSWASCLFAVDDVILGNA
ncbi:hypothetical protein AB3M75_21960 [Serratia ureilytica]|uniref:hypothetical protein n=1 Tax=Serratia ureilytica TaxID=300181 RepID=UPI003710B7CD